MQLHASFLCIAAVSVKIKKLAATKQQVKLFSGGKKLLAEWLQNHIVTLPNPLHCSPAGIVTRSENLTWLK